MHGKEARCQVIHLGELNLFLELVEAVVEAAETVDVLLVLPRHLRLRAVALRNQSPATATTTTTTPLGSDAHRHDDDDEESKLSSQD